MAKVKEIALRRWNEFRSEPIIKSTDVIFTGIGVILSLWALILIGAFAYAGTIRVLEIASRIVSM